MLAKVKSAAVVGLHCEEVEVETDFGGPAGKFIIVGLPDKSVEESRERIHMAIKSSAFRFPFQKITVNLAPADLRKEGPAYDLPIAVALLMSVGEIPQGAAGESLFVGELAFDGKLRHTNGILPVAIFAREKNFKKIFVPKSNIKEAQLITGVDAYPVESLGQLVNHLRGAESIKISREAPGFQIDEADEFEADFAYVKGQEHVKRALEITASGGHNVLMSGPPGAGKTLLARTIPSILPAMTMDEVLEVTKIYSVAGKLPSGEGLIKQRPFRAPHHSSSAVALVGGGNIPRPGEVSLAHRGVLFLDEFPEFPRMVLENLRQPLEDGVLTIGRAQMTLTFPARFTLVASQNPCPCGYLSDPERDCTCSPSQVLKYQQKISGPILDRIDLHIEVPRVQFDKLASDAVAESSKEVRKRVQAARDKQAERFKDLKILTNSEMTSQMIKDFCQVDASTQDLLRTAVNQLHLSARAYHRILKLGRTIADLAGEPGIKSEYIAEALQYRPKIGE
ncbi:YifB family Mg chelatase-like AAA ATPase [Patescibacteria group bacterium]|nr:YifB family Mg chelatase-like AAA ATPase [Patescibacteria group bacterium]MBU4512129.1 YifB family Mg chelatase-like AAA ATPase [Patescibacteria group bacterium]